MVLHSSYCCYSDKEHKEKKPSVFFPIITPNPQNPHTKASNPPTTTLLQTTQFSRTKFFLHTCFLLREKNSIFHFCTDETQHRCTRCKEKLTEVRPCGWLCSYCCTTPKPSAKPFFSLPSSYQTNIIPIAGLVVAVVVLYSVRGKIPCKLH